MDFIISDTHQNHTKILQHESETRGHFKNVEEMNTYLVDAWNRVVTPNDKVYHLGDVSLYMNYENLKAYLSSLNGKKVIILGNHDDPRLYRKLKAEGLIEDFCNVGLELKRHGQTFWLTHYPIDLGYQKNRWSLHGHIHGRESRESYQLNVSVDSPFLARLGHPFGEPIALDTLVDYMVNNPVENPYKQR